MKISVICVTNRKGAIAYLKQQLDKQTFKDFEVIIANDSSDEGGFKPRQKNENDVWNLNKAHNDALEKAQGELIVFLQDFIFISANGLQRFWDIYQLYPTSLITGCGHKYENRMLAETDERCFGEYKLVDSDWTYYELNWASCPKNCLQKFDEDMDTHYGGENQIFALKATLAGFDVKLDRTNICQGEVHHDRPKDWEQRHSNKGFLNEKIKEYAKKFKTI